MLYRRLPRVDLPGHMYFITGCLEGRRPVLKEEALADLLLDLYVEARERGRISLHAYVLMPDHYHLLLTLHGDASISGLVRRVHSAFSRRYRDTRAAAGRLWQRRFYDHVIRDERDWQECWNYIHANPVMAGLVSNPTAYLWSSCAFWETGEGPVRCDAPR
jgi:putative transposase